MMGLLTAAAIDACRNLDSVPLHVIYALLDVFDKLLQMHGGRITCVLLAVSGHNGR